MSNEQALLNCTFGWGKTCRLYYDSIEVAGKSYNLKDLTSIQPSYRIVLGVPSARLELSFGLDHLVLRGIADLDLARLMVSHLRPYCSTMPHTAYGRSRSSRSRKIAREQARVWERTNKIPALLNVQEESKRACPSVASDKADKAISLADFDAAPPTDQALSLEAVPRAPIEDTSLTPGETLEAFAQLASNLSTYSSPLPTMHWQPPHTPRFQPPLHSVHLIPPNQKFDSNSMPVPAVKSNILPIIHVPVRLQHRECAHYSIGAALCSDRISSSARAMYPLLDNGLLILTNRRVLYIGKRCQFTLAYTHLWYVSLLHNSIALHIEGQFRRIIVELEHPQEWASRIELLSFIARRSRPEPPTASVPAVPGLNMTLKRKAVKIPTSKQQISLDNTTMPLLAERVEAKIVDARTLELRETLDRACADLATLDLPPSPSEAEPLEMIRANTPRTTDQPAETDLATLTTREIAQSFSIENAPTQELSPQPALAFIATQEFVPDAQHDVALITTQEFALEALQARNEDRKHGLPIEKKGPQAKLRPPEPPNTQDKTTQDLQLDREEIARLQATQPAEHRPEITTSALYNPTFLLSAYTRRNGELREESGKLPDQDEPDDDDSTIQLRDRKLCQLRTVPIGHPVSDKLAADETQKRRTMRVRVPLKPS